MAQCPLFHHWVLRIELRLSVLVASTFIYPLIHFISLLNSYYIYLSMSVVGAGVVCLCHDAHMEARGQRIRINYSLPDGD